MQHSSHQNHMRSQTMKSMCNPNHIRRHQPVLYKPTNTRRNSESFCWRRLVVETHSKSTAICSHQASSLPSYTNHMHTILHLTKQNHVQNHDETHSAPNTGYEGEQDLSPIVLVMASSWNDPFPNVRSSEDQIKIIESNMDIGKMPTWADQTDEVINFQAF